jgi:tetratricopeptide (TPR) repeat protein
MFMDQSHQRDFHLTPRRASAPSKTYSPGLAYINKPPPKAASDLPITIEDTIRKVNHHILRSCALLAHDEVDEALKEADFALYLAQARKIYHLQSKSQFYRGLCLMELKRWEEASTAFTRAANVRGWAGRIAELKIEAERKFRDAEERRKLKGGTT